MIDQMSLGHEFLEKEFNFYPKIGWQIDTFGHSATQAVLLSAKLGFTAMYFARIDYQDYNQRKRDKTLEFRWRPSQSLPSSVIFTGVLQEQYGPPDGFNFERDPPIVDDPMSVDYNLNAKLDAFIAVCQKRAACTRDNHIMLTMGEDFTYSDAHLWFSNMDKLIQYANEEGKLNVFYSTPTQYTKAKLDQNISWTEKHDDFFPYAEKAHSYWTGYFTSRTTLKYFGRQRSGILQMARQLEVFARMKTSRLTTLERAVAILQHHDGISGTEKQHVAYDYAKRLARGLSETRNRLSQSLSVVLNTTNNFHFCWKYNVSECLFTKQHDSEFRVVLYNPLGHTRDDFIRIPISSPNITFLDEKGIDISFDVIQNSQDPRLSLQSLPFTAIVPVTLSPLGFGQLYAAYSDKIRSMQHVKIHDEPVILSNMFVELAFSSDCGVLVAMRRKDHDLRITLSQEFQYYASYAGHDQASGAYVFRPASDKATGVSECPAFEVYDGENVVELRQTWSPWVQQTYRLYKDAKHVEVEWTVGPIPMDDQIGKEVITKYSSDIQSEGIFYTDSNGREYVERKRNYRPSWNLQVNEPVAGNYYPVNTGIYIKDNRAELTVLTDRSQGGSSIEDGQIELMIHRRTLSDDNKGVGEALNEPGEGLTDGLVARGVHYLLLDIPSEASQHRRQLMERIFLPPLVAYHSPRMVLNLPEPTSINLPVQVQISTLQVISHDTFRLRLAHQYAIKDIDSKPAVVFVDDLFPFVQVVRLTEVSLTGTKRALKNRVPRQHPVHHPFEVRLEPMQIRTYGVTFI